MNSKGISRPNAEQLRLSLDSWETSRTSRDPEEMTAGPSSHWTLSAATPSANNPYALQPSSVYGVKSSALSASTQASYYPDARDDPRRLGFLPQTTGFSNPVTSPPVLVLKLYRRKTRTEKTAQKLSDAAHSSRKAVGKFLHSQGASRTPDGSPRAPSKLRRAPSRRPIQHALEISAPFPSGDKAGFEPHPPPQPILHSVVEASAPSRSWHLPSLSRAKTQNRRVVQISSPFPIRDPPPGATRIQLGHLSPEVDTQAARRNARHFLRWRPSGPRTPTYVNFPTQTGVTVQRELRRTKSERQGARLPGWKYFEYSPVLVEEQSSSLVQAMSSIVRGKDHPFPAPKPGIF
ncbi:hypothetical protein C8R43DRAFT_1233921 [Mycena crocata]|nr:hypothetical protein C8R43DRAFT_1233921 [Mycena crocata]